MSAFIVSERHLSAIVKAAARHHLRLDHRGQGVLLEEERRELFTSLLRVNVRSVAYRYDERDESNLPGPVGGTGDYRYRPETLARQDLAPLQTFKLCDNLEYQCDCHPDWDGSVEERFLFRLKTAAMSVCEAYGTALWAI